MLLSLGYSMQAADWMSELLLGPLCDCRQRVST
jgi:hypothetical protein